MNPFTDTLYMRSESGRLFRLHWKNRHTGAELLLLAGATTAVVSQVKQGQIAKSQGDFANKVAQRNQESLERQGKAERDAAAIEESRIARREKITNARLLAGSAKSNIGLAGASLESLTDAAFQFSLDRNFTLRRGLLRSRELTQRGKILSSEGRFAKIIGTQRRNTAFIGAAGTALLAGSQLGKSPKLAGSGAGSQTKSFLHGGGKLSSGSTSLFDLNTGIPSLGRTFT